MDSETTQVEVHKEQSKEDSCENKKLKINTESQEAKPEQSKKNLSFEDSKVKTDSESQKIQEGQPEDDSSSEGNELNVKKLYSYLERIAKEQEKTNKRLQSIIENQRQERLNNDRITELLYKIAFCK